MRLCEFFDPRLPVTTLLKEAPVFGALPGEDGLPCRVWKNPSAAVFSNALSSPEHSTEGLRGILSVRDIYVWQSNSLLHGGFVRQTGIDGVRVGLRAGFVEINNEAVAFPEEFAWVYGDVTRAQAMDIEARRIVVSAWIRGFEAMVRLYPSGFEAGWYM